VANHKSAEKRHRQSEKRRERNRVVRSQVKTESKKLRTAIETGEKETVEQQLRKTTAKISKAASKGVLKKQTASRRISRLSKAAHKALTPTT
jgi:small subunit ribosomal protein S20